MARSWNFGKLRKGGPQLADRGSVVANDARARSEPVRLGQEIGAFDDRPGGLLGQLIERGL